MFFDIYLATKFTMCISVGYIKRDSQYGYEAVVGLSYLMSNGEGGLPTLKYMRSSFGPNPKYMIVYPEHALVACFGVLL